MTKVFKNIWNWADGNKTIIFNTSAAILQQAVSYDLIEGTKSVNFTIGVLLTLGGGSLFHHIKKGLKAKK